MKVEGEGQLLRIYIGESDRWEGRPLYEAIVRAAREQGLAGATALRGIEGFGATSRIHTVKVLRLSEDLPIVVEIADRPERIAAFMPTIDKMVREGLVTLEKVNMLVYRHDRDDSNQPAEDELQLETAEPRSAQTSAPSNPQSEEFKATDRARQIIEWAEHSAANSHRVYIDSVDVLLAMLRDAGGVAQGVLTNLPIDAATVERCLLDEVSRDETSDVFLAALEEKSAAEARWLDHHYVGTEHLLLALCEIRPNAATDILMRLGAQPREICKEVLEILGRHDDWQRWLADHPDM
jgi:PII-like signaling protein